MLDLKDRELLKNDRIKFNLHLRAENKPARKFYWVNPEEADGIPILARQAVSLSDPNIKATFNNFAVIMNKKAGYLAGNIKRKYADTIPDSLKNSINAKYEEFDRLNNTDTLFSELMASCAGWGNTYTLCYIDKPEDEEITENKINYPVRIREVEAWNSKVEYDDNKEPEKAYIYEQKRKEKRIKVYEYDKLFVSEYYLTESGRIDSDVIQYRHGFTEIPLIEWKNNKLSRGNAQNAVSLMDAYDRLMSDNITEWATFRQAYLFLKNMGLIDETTAQRMQKTGAIIGQGESSEVRFVTKDVNPEFVKFITEKTWSSIWIVAASIDPEAIGSLTNATAFQIQQMYANMESDCKFTEQCWMKSFEYLDRVLKSYWVGLDINSIPDYSTYDIDYEMIRTIPKDVMTYLKDLRTAGGLLPNAEILKQAGYDDKLAEELASQAADENVDMLPNLV
ncbi:MAG: phage portal protein [Elusimicrobia bacterium]|nr:phage portal protein [Elusimicrobiota bacterium]